MLFGDLGERRQRRRIVRLVGQVRRHGSDDVARVDGIEHLEHARDFEAMKIRRRRRQWAQRDLVEIEPRPRQLAVIGGRKPRRAVVIGARVVVVPGRLRGAALPIERTRQRNRIGDAFGDAGEMRKRDGRLVQEGQRDPARRELLVGAVILVIRRRGAVGDLIGHFDIAEVEQLAREQPPLDPPLIDIAQRRRIVRRRDHPAAGLVDLVAAAQQLRAAENIAGVVLGRRRHGFEQRLGVAGLVDDRGARFGDRKLRAVEMMRRPQSGVVVLGIEAGVHARLVVFGGDEAGEHVAAPALRDRRRSRRCARRR